MTTYRLRRRATLTEDVHRIADRQIDLAIRDLQSPDLDVGVHEVRKRLKKVRALLRLVREPGTEAQHREEDRRLREIADGLSAMRDRSVAVETLDGLTKAYDRLITIDAFTGIRADLATRRDAARAMPDMDAAVAALRETRERIPTWQVHGDGFEALANGFGRVYAQARARRDRALATPTDTALHAWRRRVKDHRHHLQLLEPSWPAVIGAHRREADLLSELLGQDHDLVVLRETVREQPPAGEQDAVAVLVTLVAQHRAALLEQARRLGDRCFAEPPGIFVQRIGRYWRSWQQDGATP